MLMRRRVHHAECGDGMCGDNFWDALVTHPDVTKTYYNRAAAQELRQGTAFEAMRFGGIDWLN
jgi:Phage major capsid protein E